LKQLWIQATLLGLLVQSPAFAIDAKYAKKLDRSGCTEVTEMQGCDINKTKAENAKAGHATAAPTDQSPPGGKAGQTPYTGQWTAVGPTGGTVAKIRIDDKAHVWVNGKSVKARRSDGALVFKQGFITYTIQGDRRLKGQDTWSDSDAGSTGPIVAQ
jgi:hypothetical protein